VILAIEWFAAGLGLLGVILGFQQRRLTWLAWLLSSVLYLGLTWHWALFGQSLVMAAFALVSVWGYVRWGQNVAVVVVPSRRVVMGSLGATAALTMGLVFWLESAGSVSPGLDASIAALSLLAMVWTARKHEACWLIWLVVNLLSVWLYSAQALWPTVGLYGVQAVLSGVGLMQWRAMHHTQETPPQMAT
jgi:nicotinamide mononucleotide transporter